MFKIYNVQFENCKFKLLFSVNLVYLQAVNILNAGEKRFYHVQCARSLQNLVLFISIHIYSIYSYNANSSNEIKNLIH